MIPGGPDYPIEVARRAFRRAEAAAVVPGAVQPGDHPLRREVIIPSSWWRQLWLGVRLRGELVARGRIVPGF